MSSHWSQVDLGQLTEDDRSITYGVVKPGEEVEGGVVFVRGGDVFQGRLALSELRTIAPQLSQVYKRTILRGGELLVSLVGNPGEVAIAPPELAGANIARQVGMVPFCADINAKFVMYFLMSPLGRAELFTRTGGAVQQVINLAELKTVKIPVPSTQEQQRIADVLSAYDDLIDINNRRIQLLEKSARLLFREWFVYFRFPRLRQGFGGQAGHEKVKIIDGVPEGWTKEKINKLVTFKRGVEPGSDNYLETYESGSFPFFRVSDLVDRNPSIFVDEQYAKSALLKKSDIVVSLDGSVGIVSMGLEGCYSTGIRKLVVKDKKINRAYLYFLMKSHYVQGVINAYSKGTTIQHAGEAIKHMNPILPPQNLMDLFDEIASPALNEILILLDQNQKLAQARDLLLPRLMSGAIVV